MGKHIECDEIMNGCTFKASAETEEELLEKVSAHAAETHGLEEIPPEVAASVKAAIRSR